jgi:hypothetical protein
VGSWTAATQRDRGPSFARACPFRSHAQRRWLRDRESDSWADAVAFDHQIRHGHQGGKAELLGTAYLDASLVPLDEVDLSTPEDHRQLLLLDGVAGECEGRCGR